VVEGSSSVDASLLTGESRPVRVGPGDPVHAGTLNVGGRIVVRVEAAGEQTRVGRLMRLVEESAGRKAPVVRLADRISGVFVATVLVLAAITAALWWSAGAGVAIDRAIALLIVTCPCALGLATPLAVSAAIGRAGRAGLLIKGGDALERLARPGRVLVDKTGTLTEGRTALHRFWGDDAIRPWVLAVESHSSHPVARAFVEALDRGGPRPSATLEGAPDSAGVIGRVGARRLTIGSPAFVAPHATRPAVPGLDEAVERLVADGLTPVVIAVDDRPCAAAGFGDPLRQEAPATVQRLRELGWEVGILSGDHPTVVAAVGRRLGLDAEASRGGVLPEQKLARIERAAAEGTVLMVGDGVNDAAALSAATVGVAVHGGAEVAMSVADVYLSRPGLEPLIRLLEGARRTLRVIRWNLLFSLGYNVVGAGLAMAGWIGPLAAAVLMPLSSITVIAISFRSRTFDPLPQPAREG
jgi:Cu2+-exporting ATPase